MTKKSRPAAFPLDEDPLWYKDAIIYELHVRAFFDSDGDGIGDFQGLTQKLDYLQDLGVNTLWLLPFYPSPLRDDGYDIADYMSVHHSYGDLRDFKTFLKEAHKRRLRVVTELVVNHTSDQHPWFQRARRSKPESKARNFYVWSQSPDKFRHTRIIFKDFESSNWAWDPIARAYYWHRFYSHQPDLNYDNPAVHKAIIRVMDFWLKQGVDGLRLDAVPYLYQREGTSCENLPETYEFLRLLRKHVEDKFYNRMLLAEANQWPEDAVAYFGKGDVCHMAFHFPLMPRLFMAIRTEDRFPIVDILNQTPRIPDNAQWALFLRNHDELTLEMVTDEERDYMYRVYATDPQARINLGIRRRLAPLLGNNRRKIELMNGLLLSLPGTPVLYYGDEIGMGDNIYLGDRNGVRTPMQWSPDRNGGFSIANPHRLYLPVNIDPEYHYEALNVEAQQNNPHSLLWWMKRVLAFRKHYKAFGRGSLEFLHPRNNKILAFIRRYEDETILIIANLSRFVQGAELQLSEYANTIPVEIFGKNVFPTITESPYFLTLGPHNFFWFSLERQRAATGGDMDRFEKDIPELRSTVEWKHLFKSDGRKELAGAMSSFLETRRWFGGKARTLRSTTIVEAIPIGYGESLAYVCFLVVDYAQGDPEHYLVPLAFAWDDRAEEIIQHSLNSVLARYTSGKGGKKGIIYDATIDPGFNTELLNMIQKKKTLKGEQGSIIASTTQAFRAKRASLEELEPSSIKTEQSNTSVVFGEHFILKLFRRLEPGQNPDLELGKFLTEKEFPHISPMAGALEYKRGREEPISLGILQNFIPNQGDAWDYTQDTLSRYLERLLAWQSDDTALEVPAIPLLELAEEETPELASELIGTYLESARLLGRRTSELHTLLASEADGPDFEPESFTPLSQRSLYQSLRNLANHTAELLLSRLDSLPEEARQPAEQVLAARERIHDIFKNLLEHQLDALRIRCHGDYHLGQVLYTGNNFIIIDFEGEPTRPLGERRLKRSPLRDVAGMLRSFHYAAHTALFQLKERGLAQEERLPLLEKGVRFWTAWVSAAFLNDYLQVAEPHDFLPKNKHDLQLLLSILVLEKAIYEIAYELNNRPDWVKIPLQGVLQLLAKPVRGE
jgi:maltose alpha-D-glucosyltransferase / alpha-amylase